MGFIDTKKAKDPGFKVAPAGRYIALIKKAEWKANSKNTGRLLKYSGSIIKGEEKGINFFGNMNLIHQNQEAQEIALSELKGLTHAIYGEDKEYPSEKAVVKAIVQKKVGVILGVEEYNGKDKNVVAGWFDPDDEPAGKSDKESSQSDGDPWGDDKPKKDKKKKKKKDKPEPDPDDSPEPEKKEKKKKKKKKKSE